MTPLDRQTTSPLDQLCINTIRTLAMDAVQQAKSGHPGAPMALAPVAYLLWDRYLRHNPANPQWPNRDRFILSGGHGSMLLYSLLHLFGYDLPLEELKRFRQWASRTPGHPEHGLTPGVEVTTGPLGQGLGTSVGIAIAERWLAAHFNRPGHELVDFRTFAICGDGDMMEGVSSEAASLAGHLGLHKLLWIYDNNRITIEGGTHLAFSEDVATRFLAYGWNVQHVGDVNDLPALARAIELAGKETSRPSLIIVDSHIGYGAPNKQDTHAAHGEPLGEEEIRLTKKRYGWPEDAKFLVPQEVLDHTRQALKRGAAAEEAWKQQLAAYGQAHPDLAREWELLQSGRLPEGWDREIPTFPADAKGLASRESGGKVLNAIAKTVPWLLGGAADLAPSTKTNLSGAGDFAKGAYGGRNFHFGVREHAMTAICNGMALCKLRPYGSGFFVFSDYAKPALRLAALMELPVIHVFTHDSIGVGEDGPTHQPIEQLAALRAIPHMVVIRPADANEVAEAWRVALEQQKNPVALILSRQAMPTLDRTRYAPAAGLRRGGYILADSNGTPDVILIGSGSEVQFCCEAAEKLAAEGVKVRLVSMPSFELFERQPREYRDQVLPPAVRKRVAIEAGAPLGWHRYIGLDGALIAREGFGASAPFKELWQQFGFTSENVYRAAKALLGH
ncbi:MAG TPA: transketolase [Verrucomicrobiota bacterium]|nr:transketolase [Verrucomicrobiota bacterium]HRT07321.1 transketolase [Candidatus Paceibacterota bacterium]HRT58143.1 transketolase [Candidatus Paceibacterota bacterium]